MNPALRDKMLKLMGGCEHIWGDFSDNGMTRYFCKRPGCGASNYESNPPTVGDGHEPTTDELLALLSAVYPGKFVTANFWQCINPGDGGWACDIYVQATPFAMMWRKHGYGDTPATALASAIDAALPEEVTP